MYVCLFMQIQEEFATNIACECDTCCDVTHSKRNVLKIFYLKSNINQDRFNVRQK